MIKWEYTTIKLEAKGWFVGGNFDKSKCGVCPMPRCPEPSFECKKVPMEEEVDQWQER